VHRRGFGREVRERPGPLQLAVAGALREVPGDYGGIGAEVRNHFLERLDLPNVGEGAEVQIGEVQQLDGHESACTVYVSVAVPPAATATRKRTSVAESFSAGRLLSTICHMP